MIRWVVALLPAGVGVTLSGVAQLLAQTAPDVAPTDVTTWVSAGGTTMAVGGLVYMARLLASGHLVAFPVERLQERADERETVLTKELARALDREKTLERILIRRHGGPDEETPRG